MTWGLTQREREVAMLLARGLSYAEIAQMLGISPHTAATHIKSILKKTGASSSRYFVAMWLGRSRTDAALEEQG